MHKTEFETDFAILCDFVSNYKEPSIIKDKNKDKLIINNINPRKIADIAQEICFNLHIYFEYNEYRTQKWKFAIMKDILAKINNFTIKDPCLIIKEDCFKDHQYKFLKNQTTTNLEIRYAFLFILQHCVLQDTSSKKDDSNLIKEAIANFSSWFLSQNNNHDFAYISFKKTLSPKSNELIKNYKVTNFRSFKQLLVILDNSLKKEGTNPKMNDFFLPNVLSFAAYNFKITTQNLVILEIFYVSLKDRPSIFDDFQHPNISKIHKLFNISNDIDQETLSLIMSCHDEGIYYLLKRNEALKIIYALNLKSFEYGEILNLFYDFGLDILKDVFTENCIKLIQAFKLNEISNPINAFVMICEIVKNKKLYNFILQADYNPSIYKEDYKNPNGLIFIINDFLDNNSTTDLANVSTIEYCDEDENNKSFADVYNGFLLTSKESSNTILNTSLLGSFIYNKQQTGESDKFINTFCSLMGAVKCKGGKSRITCISDANTIFTNSTNIEKQDKILITSIPRQK